MDINFGLTLDDYSKYRVPYPDELFKRLYKKGIGLDGQSLLDLGTGTGMLSRKFASLGLKVAGIDISEELLKEAKRLNKIEGVHIEYLTAEAENVPYKKDSFDIVTAAQCWHWFKHVEVLREVSRVLKKNGKLIIIHLDWLPIRNNIVAQTEKLICSYNPSWTGHSGNGVYPDWLTQVSESGYANIETFTFDLAVTFTHEEWKGRVRASAGVGASLSPENLEKFNDTLGRSLEKEKESLIIPHRVFCLVCTNDKT